MVTTRKLVPLATVLVQARHNFKLQAGEAIVILSTHHPRPSRWCARRAAVGRVGGARATVLV